MDNMHYLHTWDQNIHQEKKNDYGKFFYFCADKYICKRIQKMKIRPLKGFEKIRFFVFLHYRGILAQNIPKSDFRGPKITPRGASST